MEHSTMTLKQFRELEHVIDLQREEPKSLAQAGKILSKSHPTVFRYSTTGCRGVVLETVKLGKQRLTSMSAIQRFLDRLADVEA
jgi:hypothetical protein